MIKSGVKAKGIQPEILLAIQEARAVYQEIGAVFVITSLTRRTNPESLHYEGLAFDCRTRHLSVDERSLAAGRLRVALGPDYDVVHEKDHIHVEFDPK